MGVLARRAGREAHFSVSESTLRVENAGVRTSPQSTKRTTHRYRRNLEISASTTVSTTLRRIEVASGK